jgi:membrane protease YdiL (CAAX protease family)
MASPSQNLRTTRLYHGASPPLPPSTALATWGLAVATFFGVGLSLGAGLAANSAAEVLALAIVPLAVVHLHGGRTVADTARTVGLGRPPWRAIAGAVLAGACTWYVLLRIALPILEVMERERVAEDISRSVLGDNLPLGAILLASALVPGVCEELLHRGVLLPALTSRTGRRAQQALAVVVTALMFALMHLEPARIVATFVLGLAAGFLSLRTGSLWPAIALHTTNNAATILVATSQMDPIAAALHRHPDVGLTIAIAGSTAGLALATWATPARSRQS